jgi:hypothetical protein
LPESGEEGIIYGLLDEPQVLTIKKQLSGMDEFAAEYNHFIDQERALMNTEEDFLPFNHSSSGGIDFEKYLFEKLEEYMSYSDDTVYKETYRDIIFTIVRQLRRYGAAKQDLARSNTTKAYYKKLNDQYKRDIQTYGQQLAKNIS